MTTFQLHKSIRYNNRPAIIDAAEIVPGLYEVMAMYNNGAEIASRTTNSADKAARIFSEMCRDLDVPALLTGKYAKLRDDIRAALNAGRAAEDADPEDGGTCNFDAAAVKLPRWCSEKVIQAAKEAGTSCSKWSYYGSGYYVINPDTRAQANARSRNAEAVTAALKAAGYDAFDYAQID